MFCIYVCTSMCVCLGMCIEQQGKTKTMPCHALVHAKDADICEFSIFRF